MNLFAYYCMGYSVHSGTICDFVSLQIGGYEHASLYRRGAAVPAVLCIGTSVCVYLPASILCYYVVGGIRFVRIVRKNNNNIVIR